MRAHRHVAAILDCGSHPRYGGRPARPRPASAVPGWPGCALRDCVWLFNEAATQRAQLAPTPLVHFWITCRKRVEGIQDDLRDDQSRVEFVIGGNDVTRGGAETRCARASLASLHIGFPITALLDIRRWVALGANPTDRRWRAAFHSIGSLAKLPLQPHTAQDSASFMRRTPRPLAVSLLVDSKKLHQELLCLIQRCNLISALVYRRNPEITSVSPQSQAWMPPWSVVKHSAW